MGLSWRRIFIGDVLLGIIADLALLVSLIEILLLLVIANLRSFSTNMLLLVVLLLSQLLVVGRL